MKDFQLDLNPDHLFGFAREAFDTLESLTPNKGSKYDQKLLTGLAEAVCEVTIKKAQFYTGENGFHDEADFILTFDHFKLEGREHLTEEGEEFILEEIKKRHNGWVEL